MSDVREAAERLRRRYIDDNCNSELMHDLRLLVSQFPADDDESRCCDAMCRDIIQAIVAKCQETKKGETAVSFEPDWGGNSLTVCISGMGHSHAGDPDSSFELLVENLHGMFCGGSHLSFVKEQANDQ